MSRRHILLAAAAAISLAASGSFAAAQGAKPAPADATKPTQAKPPVAENMKPPAAESAKPAPASDAAKPATQDAARPATAGVAPGAPPGAVVQPADIRGFRSAHFGMDEAAVRAAIQEDFGKEIADRIQVQENTAEKTRVLNALVPNLFEGAGTAGVSYVFGYRSKKLIQVVVLWSPQTDQALTPETLYSSAAILQGYFTAQGYVSETIVTGAVMDAGLLMFRGSDKDGNTTMLLLQGGFAGEGARRNLTPNALLLYYIDDAKNPDVFRIPAGKF
ncbi:hypothetical protein [Rhizobium terrae]|uniref:hypothetical protein n=1 Tax=Rhizobium terrae TaxID=2171756 RepID=UPI000E3BFA05|nr:hypothetical protein [Rhizobium terrae]